VLFLDIGSPEWGSGGKLFRVFGGVSDVSILHVTFTSNPRGILDARDTGDRNPNLMFGYNLVERVNTGSAPAGAKAFPRCLATFLKRPQAERGRWRQGSGSRTRWRTRRH
jgi:hypothetical protein